jgi:hypothetical protein
MRLRSEASSPAEAQLPELETFANTSLAFDQAEPVRFRGGKEQFQLKPGARRSSTAVEGLLSRALIVAWGLGRGRLGDRGRTRLSAMRCPASAGSWPNKRLLPG